MLDKRTARAIAESLVEAWNRHDLEDILTHYHCDVVVTNPLFCVLLGIEDGVIRGRDSLKPFWAKVLQQLPHLRFKLLDVYVGVDNFVVHYVGMFEKNVVEVFTVNNDGKVVTTVTYLDSLELP